MVRTTCSQPYLKIINLKIKMSVSMVRDIACRNPLRFSVMCLEINSLSRSI